MICQIGFGKQYHESHPEIDTNIQQWYMYLTQYFKLPGLTISFDNLAISQLRLSRYFTEAAWERFYMGDDGVLPAILTLLNSNLPPHQHQWGEFCLMTKHLEHSSEESNTAYANNLL